MDVLDVHLDKLRNKLEGKIDFEGQELAEHYQRQILWSSGGLAFLIGLLLQSLQTLLIIFSLGFFLCLFITAPAYSTYNQHPIEWLPTLNDFGLAAAVPGKGGPGSNHEISSRLDDEPQAEEGKKDR